MKTSVDDNRQLELNALGCSWPVKTVICSRAPKSSNRPGSRAVEAWQHRTVVKVQLVH